MIYVLTVLIGGFYYQSDNIDPISCRVLQAHNTSIGAKISRCEWVKNVAA